MSQFPEERRALVEAAMAEGWPLIEITRTHRVTWKTLRRHFPEYRGVDRHTAATMGAAARRATLQLRKARA